jgi:hypothetical protein
MTGRWPVTHSSVSVVKKLGTRAGENGLDRDLSLLPKKVAMPDRDRRLAARDVAHVAVAALERAGLGRAVMTQNVDVPIGRAASAA